ncbi:MAG: hypothetical protein NTU73_11185, partial [Ignavibacteriae bacterium]|nr:hypothetical protein [Ignavibacteriota bacterium]
MKKLILFLTLLIIQLVPTPRDCTFLIINCKAQSWSPLGSGTGGAYPDVNALTVFNNEIIVGGYFQSAGGVSANYIAKWNGTTWSPLG